MTVRGLHDNLILDGAILEPADDAIAQSICHQVSSVTMKWPNFFLATTINLKAQSHSADWLHKNTSKEQKLGKSQ